MPLGNRSSAPQSSAAAQQAGSCTSLLSPAQCSRFEDILGGTQSALSSGHPGDNASAAQINQREKNRLQDVNSVSSKAMCTTDLWERVSAEFAHPSTP